MFQHVQLASEVHLWNLLTRFAVFPYSKTLLVIFEKSVMLAIISSVQKHSKVQVFRTINMCFIHVRYQHCSNRRSCYVQHTLHTLGVFTPCNTRLVIFEQQLYVSYQLCSNKTYQNRKTFFLLLCLLLALLKQTFVLCSTT